jgi:chemotaxis protein MotB
MLYAMSVMNVTKFQMLAVSVRSGFGGSTTNGAPTILDPGGGVNGQPAIVTNGQTKNRDDQNDARSELTWGVPSHRLEAGEEAKRLEDLSGVLRKIINDKKLSGKVQVIENERGITIRLLTDNMLFESGQADLNGNETALLDDIAHTIRTMVDNPIAVEGHTDNLPIDTPRFPSNWELSTTRATTVLRYLGDHGVNWNRLQAAGYADQRPVASNDSEQGRRLNRRVDIVVLRRYHNSTVTNDDA